MEKGHTLNLSIANIEEFIAVIEKIKNQAEELQKTISQLDGFKLNVEIS